MWVCRHHYRQAVAMSLDEHEAIAPFLALVVLHIKVTVLTAVAVLQFLAKYSGLTLAGQLAWWCISLVWPLLRALGAAGSGLAGVVLHWEKTLLALLCCGLAAVLWLRHHRRRQSHAHHC